MNLVRCYHTNQIQKNMNKKNIYLILIIVFILTLIILVFKVFIPQKNNFNYDAPVIEISNEQIEQNPFGIHAAGGQFAMLNELKTTGRYIFYSNIFSNKTDIEKIDYYIFRSNQGIHMTLNSKTEEAKEGKHNYYLLSSSELQKAVENTKKIVERYDGDNNYGCTINNEKDCYTSGDGLYPRQELIEVLKQRPIKYWQIENEWLWQILDPKTGKQASNEDLLHQFIILSNAIKETDLEAKVIMGAFAGLRNQSAYDGYNADKYIEMGHIDCAYEQISLINLGPKETEAGRKAKEQVLFFLKNGAPYYDVVDFHSYNNNPINLGLEAKWLKDQLKILGIESKEIWSMENAGPFYFFNLLGLSKEEYCNQSIYDAGIHAEHVIKRYVVGIHNGISKIFYSSLYPTLSWQENFTRLSLVEEDLTKKPAYYTYKIMTENLIGFTDIEKIEHQYEGVFIYKFTVNDNPIFVVWSESGEKIINLSPQTNKQSAEITRIVTALDEKNNPIYKPNETIFVNNVKLTEEPIFLD